MCLLHAVPVTAHATSAGRAGITEQARKHRAIYTLLAADILLISIFTPMPLLIFLQCLPRAPACFIAAVHTPRAKDTIFQPKAKAS